MPSTAKESKRSARQRIAERVQKARKAREMSQQTLAHHAGTTTATVSEIETAQTNVRLDTLERVARVLGLEIVLDEVAA